MMSNEDSKNTAEKPEEEAQTQQEPKQSPFISFQKVNVAIKPGYVLRKVGQAFMVMPAGPRMKEYQGMITLNETGAFLFKEAQKEAPTKEKFIEACIAEYAATPEEAEQAADAFILQCVECGLMESEIKYFDMRTGKEVTLAQIDEEMKNEPAE
jgi:hypothetical protein